MRQQILALLAAGKTYNQIVAEVGCAKSTVAYHAKNVKPPPNYKVHDWAEVQAFYDEGHTVKKCREHFGICANVWYNAVRSGKVVMRSNPRIPLDILTAEKRNTGRAHLRGRLIKDGVLRPLCAECGIREWNGKPLSLHLHHRNGINDDNTLSNLQLLCPNCHSQTETYSGRNAKRTTRNNAG